MKRSDALAGAEVVARNGWRAWVEHHETGKRIFESEQEKAHQPKEIHMPEITLEQAQRIYREAIDSTATNNSNDAGWWADVLKEVREVCAAKSIEAAADVIQWWHNDWSMVSDTAKGAAKRIRQAAKSIQK